MKLVEVRQKFLNHLAGERGLAEHTLANYGRVLKHDIAFLLNRALMKSRQLALPNSNGYS
ncbi:site-specific integrase [Pseudidiomarina halophila]|uniref:site-specific integrase n=1 Tax=Pseudidiomarina halophila TaxID=1449799 RepID=UPI003607374A